MKQPTFIEGTVVAAAASIAGAALFGTLTLSIASGPVLRLLIAGLGLAYVIYLLSRSSERVGRITVVAAWMVSALTIWWLTSSLMLYLLLHVILIWVIRSLYFHAGVLGSIADLGVSALALAAGVSGGMYTGSAMLGIWCFFLSQALFVFIPVWLGPHAAPGPDPGAGPDRFEIAHRDAEAALRKFSSSI